MFARSRRATIFAAIAASATMLAAPLAHGVPFDDAVAPSWDDAPANAAPDGAEPTETGPVPLHAVGTAGPGQCRLVVWDVGWDANTNWLGLQGGREHCSDYHGFRVELRKHRKWAPDKRISFTRGGGNQIVRTYHHCAGRGTYFGRVVSNTGNKIDGPRSTVCR